MNYTFTSRYEVPTTRTDNTVTVWIPQEWETFFFESLDGLPFDGRKKRFSNLIDYCIFEILAKGYMWDAIIQDKTDVVNVNSISGKKEKNLIGIVFLKEPAVRKVPTVWMDSREQEEARHKAKEIAENEAVEVMEVPEPEAVEAVENKTLAEMIAIANAQADIKAKELVRKYELLHEKYSDETTYPSTDYYKLVNVNTAQIQAIFPKSMNLGTIDFMIGQDFPNALPGSLALLS